MGDLVTSVRSVSEQSEGGVVDWKLAYKELRNVIGRIRELVLKTGLYTKLILVAFFILKFTYVHSC